MDLANGRVGIIDLGSREVSEQELSEEVIVREFSSVKVAEALASEHGKNSLILGTGLLTGSLMPAACAGIARGRPAEDGRQRISPLLGFAGMELKLTGFDFVVVKGCASEPSYLWIRDGIIELVASSGLRGTDAWARTDKIRADQGDRRVQVISAGRWGDAEKPCSQYVVNYWGGEDKSGLAADLGSKNLVAVAFRGMGEMSVTDSNAHFANALRILKEHHARLGESKGLESYSALAGRDDFRGLLHRNLACFACPYPCRSYLKLFEDPKQMAHEHKEPGYLHYDVPALSKALSIGLGVREATEAMILCAREGAEPVAVLSQAHSQGMDSVDGVRKVLADSPRIHPPPSSECIGSFQRAFPEESVYFDCLGRGLCPRYWAKVGLPLPSPGL
jgi:aldehyde:ferredoxin oxidoreductase